MTSKYICTPTFLGFTEHHTAFINICFLSILQILSLDLLKIVCKVSDRVTLMFPILLQKLMSERRVNVRSRVQLN